MTTSEPLFERMALIGLGLLGSWTLAGRLNPRLGWRMAHPKAVAPGVSGSRVLPAGEN